MREKVGAFSPIATFQHAHLNTKQMRENCLHPTNLVGLTYIHMALAGFRPIVELDKTAQGLADEFRTIREDILISALPADLKEVIIHRLNQIASALDNFAFFGTKKFEEDFTALVGSLVIYRKTLEQEPTGFFLRIASLLKKSASVVKTANDGFSTGKTALENGTELYLGISDLLN